MFEITLHQGTNLLRSVHSMDFPEALGDLKFSHAEQVSGMRDLRALYDALKRESPLLQGPEQKLNFGPKEWYRLAEKTAMTEQGPKTSHEWECLDRHAKVQVSLNGRERNGIFWVLLVWTHPASRFSLSAGAQEELAWPIARTFKCAGALSEKLGLATAPFVEVKIDDADVEGAKS